MFNLIVGWMNWKTTHGTFPYYRMFEYTDENIRETFQDPKTKKLHIDKLKELPCLFLEETDRDKQQQAKVGNIHDIQISGEIMNLEYSFDESMPCITNKQLETFSSKLDINLERFEFQRTHWAIKSPDLFKILLRNLQPQRNKPSVFTLSDPTIIKPCLSVMMPFEASFTPVYEAIESVAQTVNLKCFKADDIWNDPFVIQDVVSLIDYAKIVICDCTGRNPNVFYEAGIAHTLGRNVIFITQSKEDIPFDLQHIRYLHYLNNDEGINKLKEQLKSKLETLIYK